jgi:hypothetical protein
LRRLLQSFLNNSDMGIGVKRPKIDANQIDSLLGSESSPANESPSPSKVINSVADVPRSCE